MNRRIWVGVLLALFASVSAFAGDSQAGSSNDNNRFTVGVAFRASTLGLGGDVALPVTSRTNVRVGFNLFNYDHTFDEDGIRYTGSLSLRSVQASFDVFPFRNGFHFSPGLIFYNGNRIDANTNIPPGETFDLGDATFRSSPTSPLTGTGKLTVRKVAPAVTFGWGDLVPRTNRHVTFAIDAGIAFQGTPDVRLNFAGGACDPSGVNCRDIASDPTFQSNVLREQNKLSDDANPARFYPIVSIGIGYKF